MTPLEILAMCNDNRIPRDLSDQLVSIAKRGRLVKLSTDANPVIGQYACHIGHARTFSIESLEAAIRSALELERKRVVA